MKKINLSAHIGEQLKDYAERLIDRWERLTLKQPLKQKEEFIVVGDFNGIQLEISKESTLETIIKDYDIQCEQRHQEYINSEEYRIKQEQERIELKQLNEKANKLLNQLDNLDFSNYELILNWLSEIQSLTDRIDVNTQNQKIIKMFNTNGFKSNVNTGEEFIEEDRENFARYIIGQCLDGLSRVGAIHPAAVRFINDWKNKFEKKII